MHELTKGRPLPELFLYGHALRYFDYFSVIEDEAGAPVIENLAHIGMIFPPEHPNYHFMDEAFKFHFILSYWPDSLPTLPPDILVRLAPFIRSEGHRSLMSLLDDKQLELLSDWQRTIVAKGGPRRQEVPLQTLHDLLYVFDEVARTFHPVEEVLDWLFEHQATFFYGVEETLRTLRLHHLSITTHEGEPEVDEAVYCARYTELLDECMRSWDLEELRAHVENAYKGGGFSCMS